MSSNISTVRQIAWISIVPHLGLMGLLIFIWYQFDPQDHFFKGALTYLTISFCLRTFIPHDHRQGMSLLKQRKYLDAISSFQKSYDFFTRNTWVDRYCYLTILISSKMTHREIALNNIAFCYRQMGNKAKSKEYYEQALSEFPDSEIAQVGLNSLGLTEK